MLQLRAWYVVRDRLRVACPRVLERPDSAPEVLDVGTFLRRGRGLERRDQPVGRLQAGPGRDVRVFLVVERDRVVEPFLGSCRLLLTPPPHRQLHWSGRERRLPDGRGPRASAKACEPH